jgi:hypothetical protein|tara:strand:+ start:330 stop:599 length:270 start_codon:yes stop_codon:yes gene_type:complete
MREAQQIWDELLQHHVIKNVCTDVEKEEMNKGMRPFEKSSKKIKRQRILKVYNRWNDTNTNRKGSLTPYQWFNLHTSLGEYGKNPLYTV